MSVYILINKLTDIIYLYIYADFCLSVSKECFFLFLQGHFSKCNRKFT